MRRVLRMSLLQRKQGKQAAKAEDHLMGDVDEEVNLRMRMIPPIAIAILTARTPHLQAEAALPDRTPRSGVKVTKTGSEQNSNLAIVRASRRIGKRIGKHRGGYSVTSRGESVRVDYIPLKSGFTHENI
jgi:hypothetical protein